ncbi:MAG: hypothetical protein ACYCSN_05460 [Acidobacteriaceae bacterium]
MAGTESNGTFQAAKYWKNGAPTDLTSPSYAGIAWGISVVGGDVYVAGTRSVVGKPRGFATIWKNGIATDLTDGTQEGYASSVAISNGDVYVAGGDGFTGNGFTAEYWKNGVPTMLARGTQPAYALGIFVDGSDVYVAGSIAKTTPVPGGTYSNVVATYWKNGVPVSLADGLEGSEANSIVVSNGDVYVAGYLCHSQTTDCNAATYWKNGVPTQLSPVTPAIATSIIQGSDGIYVGIETGPNSAGYWHNGSETVLATNPGQVGVNQIVQYDGTIYAAGGQAGVAEYWKGTHGYTLTDGSQFATAYAIAVVPHQ